MPFPLIPVIMAALGAAGTAGNIASNRRANKENARLAREQRNWNEQMYHEQNRYNDPAAQMTRLKNAGLNPRLIYGQSAGSAAGNAAEVKGYDRAESRSVYNGENAFQNIIGDMNTMAQTDNVKAQEEVNKQEALYKSQQTLNSALELEQKDFDLNLSKDLRESNVKAAQANASQALHKATQASADADVSVNTKDARIRRANIDVKQAAANLKGTQLDNELKRIQKNLKEQGIEATDPVIFRALIQSGKMEQLLNSGSQFIDDLWNNGQKIFK